jgi:methionyl-tRNA formyltransferase
LSELAAVPGRARRLAYLGTPDIAVAPLLALLDGGFDIPLVITRADAKRGRGGALTPSPVALAAKSRHVPVSHDVDDVLDAAVDLAVVVAFGRLLRPHILERVPMVNIHFSLLPRWRGAAPVERALLAGDAVTGTCLMQIEEGLDTGPVFDTVVVPIDTRATADSLKAALVVAGTTQLLRCLDEGLKAPTAQTGEVSYAAKIDPRELHIDWSESAVQIDRLVRVGGAWTTFRGRRLAILAAEPYPESAHPADAPGTINGTTVATGHGGLRLVTVKPEAKSAMSANDWVNGARPDRQILGR